MKIALIGFGAIAQYVVEQLSGTEKKVEAVIVSNRLADAQTNYAHSQIRFVSDLSDIEGTVDLFVDCAGHAGLMEHGPRILRAGNNLLTVSIGALADAALYSMLDQAAREGDGTLHLVSGAVGALDALRAARVGTLRGVRYTGRKPPSGWQGSPAEHVLDLKNMGQSPRIHFQGNAREAALQYPKNANVAAAVALSGIGFERTEVTLVADPGITQNIHEISAEGEFGTLSFTIEGNPLSSNPRTSALAAMSVIASIDQYSDRLKL